MVKKITLNELGAMLTHVVNHMATKEDIEDMATKQDIARLDDRIDALDTKLSDQISGLSISIWKWLFLFYKKSKNLAFLALLVSTHLFTKKPN